MWPRSLIKATGGRLSQQGCLGEDGGVGMKSVLGGTNRPGLEEPAESVRTGKAASIMEPESSTRLAANLLCLASNCPLEAQFDLSFLELTHGTH